MHTLCLALLANAPLWFSTFVAPAHGGQLIGSAEAIGELFFVIRQDFSDLKRSFGNPTPKKHEGSERGAFVFYDFLTYQAGCSVNRYCVDTD